MITVKPLTLERWDEVARHKATRPIVRLALGS